ncbi:hypothetical protein BCR44DRAFT_57110 [Catenaria anguillulae PL171]|uniref:Uncharacterized protein n=1 Tax=Catenaria anguillulae PL171 TaxID=765915 RepID=A0A1Y2HB38_9FUNG|nr:hypothetical protein BCR44DRAFT_57110 [Catenaria anguillulae PL171]
MTRLESALSTSALTIGTRALLWDVVYVTNLHPEWKPIVLDAMHTWLAASSASIGGDTRIQRRLEQWMLMLHASATSNPKTAPTNSANTVRNLAVGLLVSYWLTTLGHGQQPALVVLRVCALVRALLRPPLLDAACAAGLADLATVCAQGLGDEADDKVRAWCRWLLSLAEKLRANGSSAMTDKDAIEASTELVLVDPCPVCGETADVLVDPESVGLISLCKNKHRMTRCCLTLAILATPKCRACTGCTKTKAAPAAAVESADNTCPMCGDRLLWSGRVPLALPPLPIPTLANPLAMGESDSDADAAAKTPAKRGRKPKSLGGSASGTSSPVPRPADASDDDKGDDGRGTPASAKAHRSAAKPKVLTEPLDMDKISRALEAERAKKGKRRATVGIPLDGDEAEGAAAGDGSVKKRRGRPPKNKKKDKQDAGEADADAEGEGEGEGEQEENGPSESVTATPTPTPKRRGRPPKNLAAAAPATTIAPDTEGVVAGTEPKRRGRQPKTPATPVPTEPKRRGRPSKAKTPTTGAAATVDAQTLVDESAKDQAQQPQINPTSAAVALMALATSAGSGEQQAGIAPPETPSARGGRGRGRGAPASSSLTASTARVAESGAAGDGRSESIEQGKDADGDVVMDDS